MAERAIVESGEGFARLGLPPEAATTPFYRITVHEHEVRQQSTDCTVIMRLACYAT
jgi:hypothetical protein